MADPTTTKSDAQAIIDAALMNVSAAERIADVEGIPLAVLPAGTTVLVLDAALKQADDRAEAPRARRGQATLTELPSFIDHVNRFKDADSAIFADVEKVKLTAVFDYHRAGAIADKGQRWGKHRSLYACPLSPQWQLWVKCNEQPMTQDVFAQLIEENLSDLASPNLEAQPLDSEMPSPAQVLTMVRQLTIRTKGEFTRKVDEVTGEFELVNKLEHDQTSTKIYRAFLLRIPVFAGADATFYRVEARIRFRMENGRAIFAYSLYRHDLVLQDAFGDVRAAVVKATALPLLAGSPE